MLVDSTRWTFPADQQNLKLLCLNSIPFSFFPSLPNSLSLSLSRGSTSSTTSGTGSTSSSKSSSKPKNWVVQRLSKILMREDTQGSKKGGLKDFLSSLWVSTHLPFCILLKKQTNKGLDPCCNLFTPKAKGELERVTLVSEPVWEGLQFAHQHSCCRAVWNGAPGWPECNNWEHQAGHFFF